MEDVIVEDDGMTFLEIGLERSDGYDGSIEVSPAFLTFQESSSITLNGDDLSWIEEVCLLNRADLPLCTTAIEGEGDGEIEIGLDIQGIDICFYRLQLSGGEYGIHVVEMDLVIEPMDNSTRALEESSSIPSHVAALRNNPFLYKFFKYHKV